MQTKNRLLVVMAVLAFSFVFEPSVAEKVSARSQSTTNAETLTFEQGVAASERREYTLAFSIFQRLALNGDAKAQNSLADLYHNGTGVPQDYAAAVSWYRKAADQGNANAQNNLGIMYKKGTGVPQDEAAAFSWYRKAAEQGLEESQYNLGVMYSKGQGVPQDSVQAYKWLILSAVSGDEDSIKSRDIVARAMTLAQIAEAQRLAWEWRGK